MLTEKQKELVELRDKLRQGGGEKAIQRQHDRGKMTARERINALLDEKSFVETGMFVKHRSNQFGMDDKIAPGDGVITGYGTIDGRLVCVTAQIFTIIGGSLGEMHADKIVKTQEMALKIGCPIISINDSGGARIQNPANFSYYGSLRRRCSLFTCLNRLCFYGGRHQRDVYHRTSGYRNSDR